MKYSLAALAISIAWLTIGCGTGQKKNTDFFTSGNREADQRADQRMAKQGQLNPGSATGDKSADQKKSLYERLGGQEGIAAVVNDFVDRMLADPRVNFERKGVTRGGLIHKSVEWNPSGDNVKKLKLHISEFVALATGGPSRYHGREMKEAHAGLRISNAEFDAAVGDLKATLDKMKVPNTEQKELLSIVETTRSQVAEER